MESPMLRMMVIARIMRMTTIGSMDSSRIYSLSSLVLFQPHSWRSCWSDRSDQTGYYVSSWSGLVWGSRPDQTRPFRSLLDGTHTRSQYNLTLLIAVGIDAEDRILPFAWA